MRPSLVAVAVTLTLPGVANAQSSPPQGPAPSPKAAEPSRAAPAPTQTDPSPSAPASSPDTPLPERPAPAQKPPEPAPLPMPEFDLKLPEAGQELPQMSWDLSVKCLNLPDGQRVRYQCDDATRTCLYSGDLMTGRTGRPIQMERLSTCSSGDYKGTYAAEKLAQGYTFKPALAEAPYGWKRDPDGRVYQVDFDLRRRFYLGAGWEPTWTAPLDGASPVAAPSFDFGFDHYKLNRDALQRDRFSVMEGEIDLDPMSWEFTAFSWERSHVSEDPFLRVTVLIGEPRRYDGNMDVGFGLSALGVSYDPALAPDQVLWRLGELHLGWDLWLGQDLTSYVRLKMGPSLEYVVWTSQVEELALVGRASLVGRFTVGERGLRLLSFDVGAEVPAYFGLNQEEAMDRPGNGVRASAQVEWERILIAINDQPISLVLTGEAAMRGDLPDETSRQEVAARVGLRYNFWAPAPPAPQVQDQRRE